MASALDALEPGECRLRCGAGPGRVQEHDVELARRPAVSRRSASAHVIVTLSAPRARAARSSAAATPRSRSTMTTLFAPREAASKPSAPVPAKRSRQRAPPTSPASQLNNVSRTRSGVGRSRSVVTTGSRRLRQRPAMMRTAPLRCRTCHAGDRTIETATRSASVRSGACYDHRLTPDGSTSRNASSRNPVVRCLVGSEGGFPRSCAIGEGA